MSTDAPEAEAEPTVGMLERASSAILDLLSSNITKVAAIITAVVGLPTSLFSCTDKQIANQAAFQAAVTQEEKRFAELHDTLFKTVGLRAKEADTYRARLDLLCMLSVRPLQTFKDYPLGGWWPNTATQDHRDAALYVQRLQSAFQDALKRDEIGGADVAECLAERQAMLADQEENRRTQTEKAGGTPDEVQEATQLATEVRASVDQPKLANADAETASASLVVSAGDRKGYDIDVFWCETGDKAGNFAQARAISAALASSAAAEPGFPVGRVRLRKLLEARQKASGYNPVGLEVRGEASEQQQRTQLANWLSSQLKGAALKDRPTSMLTPWYLSVFVCLKPAKAGALAVQGSIQ